MSEQNRLGPYVNARTALATRDIWFAYGQKQIGGAEATARTGLVVLRALIERMPPNDRSR